MKSIKVVSFVGFFTLVISMVLFAVGMNFFDNLAICIFILSVALISLVTSFVLIGSLRCNDCGKKLEIFPFPIYNMLPKFLLWMGAEARCGSCNEKI
jgi:hypothetical protein